MLTGRGVGEAGTGNGVGVGVAPRSNAESGLGRQLAESAKDREEEEVRREVEGLATPGDGRPVSRNGEDSQNA